MTHLFHRVSLLAFALMFSFVLGCSESSQPTVVSDEDELAQYAAENPTPTDIDPALADK
ncbi:secreted protein [Rhodopirellula maiorica SM1]|uniref:Secreted protein n=1 Tax=Rhodopirellula maiorica SM1 TaxID=1265738 RepID=M5RN41_9BACT|nr:hypothetical protein [Rhodopirellula maiorica]EMI16787.1 secreted protein [Rhodopirellula maiorica SM1]